MNQKMPVLQVAAKAVIVNDKNQVLIVREASSDPGNTKIGQYGLVGGRLMPGEAFSDGLNREVREETRLEIKQLKPLYIGEWRPIVQGVPNQIIGIFVHCSTSDDHVTLSDEHDDYKWIDPADRANHPMMEPDCYVVDTFNDLLKEV